MQERASSQSQKLTKNTNLRSISAGQSFESLAGRLMFIPPYPTPPHPTPTPRWRQLAKPGSGGESWRSQEKTTQHENTTATLRRGPTSHRGVRNETTKPRSTTETYPPPPPPPVRGLFAHEDHWAGKGCWSPFRICGARRGPHWV